MEALGRVVGFVLVGMQLRRMVSFDRRRSSPKIRTNIACLRYAALTSASVAEAVTDSTCKARVTVTFIPPARTAGQTLTLQTALSVCTRVGVFGAPYECCGG
mgnify:CR=1 FL=1